MPSLYGLAVPYESLSVKVGRGYERFRRGALRAFLAGQPDVQALWAHGLPALLGRTTSGTLRLRVTPAGVEYELALPDTNLGRDLLELVRRKDVKGVSFAFHSIEERWTEESGKRIRDVLKATIEEISFTSMPTYPATTIEIRHGLSFAAPPMVAQPGSVLADYRSRLGADEARRRRLRLAQANLTAARVAV